MSGFETVAGATSSASVGVGGATSSAGVGVGGATSSTSMGGATAHARIRLIEDKCTSCMICARECPVWCIHIDSHTEVDPDAPAQLTGRGMRERTINVLDRFAIDWSLCMYCGICVEECPFDALEWRHDAMPAVDSLTRLTHEIEDLA